MVVAGKETVGYRREESEGERGTTVSVGRDLDHFSIRGEETLWVGGVEEAEGVDIGGLEVPFHHRSTRNSKVAIADNQFIRSSDIRRESEVGREVDDGRFGEDMKEERLRRDATALEEERDIGARLLEEESEMGLVDTLHLVGVAVDDDESLVGDSIALYRDLEEKILLSDSVERGVLDEEGERSRTLIMSIIVNNTRRGSGNSRRDKEESEEEDSERWEDELYILFIVV